MWYNIFPIKIARGMSKIRLSFAFANVSFELLKGRLPLYSSVVSVVRSLECRKEGGGQREQEKGGVEAVRAPEWTWKAP